MSVIFDPEFWLVSSLQDFWNLTHEMIGLDIDRNDACVPFPDASEIFRIEVSVLDVNLKIQDG